MLLKVVGHLAQRLIGHNLIFGPFHFLKPLFCFAVGFTFQLELQSKLSLTVELTAGSVLIRSLEVSDEVGLCLQELLLQV